MKNIFRNPLFKAILICSLLFATVFSTTTQASAGGGGCTTYTVRLINDADSAASAGNGSGYWAMDTITRTVEVCPGEEDTTLNITDVGGFTTFAGISPNNTGNIGGGVKGTITGMMTVVVTGTINSSAPLNLGTIDMACNDQGVCTIGKSSTRATVDAIFTPGAGYSITDWGWTYTACDGSEWTNSAQANTGDITLLANCASNVNIKNKDCRWANEPRVYRDDRNRYLENHKYCQLWHEGISWQNGEHDPHWPKAH